MVDTSKLLQNVLSINSNGSLETLKRTNMQIMLDQLPKLELQMTIERKIDKSASIQSKCNAYNSHKLNTPKLNHGPTLPSNSHSSMNSNGKHTSVEQQVSKNQSQTAVKTFQNEEKVKLVKPLIKDGTPVPKLYLYPPEKIELGWKASSKPGSGLFNLGNTCYLNSGLQCLTYTSPLANYLKYHKKQCNVQPGRFCMLCVMSNHVKSAMLNSGSSFKPSSVINSVKIIAKHLNVFRQQDSHEFIKHCVMAMQKACLVGVAKDLDFHTKSTTVIDQIFGFYLRSRIKCLECKMTSDTFDLSHDLQLDIIKKIENTSIDDSTKIFFKQEFLRNENAYKCSSCKKKVTASKRFSIFNAPNIITLQLKRFVGFSGNKCGRHVNYPEKLNLRPHMSNSSGEPVWYNLYAVLVHSGFSSDSGHYYAFAKVANNNWYCFNDMSVYPVSLQKVLRQEAYCLFYEKVKRSSKLPTYKSTPHSNGKKVDSNGFKRKLQNQNNFENNKIQKLSSTKKISTFSSFSFNKNKTLNSTNPNNGMSGEIIKNSQPRNLHSPLNKNKNSDIIKVLETSDNSFATKTDHSKQYKENDKIKGPESDTTSSSNSLNKTESSQNGAHKRKFDFSNRGLNDTNIKKNIENQKKSVNKQGETSNHLSVSSLASIKNNYSSSDSDSSPPVKKINSFHASDKTKSQEKSVSQKLIEQSRMHSFGAKNLGTWDGTSSNNNNKKKRFVRDEWDREYDKGKRRKNKKKNKNKFSSMNNNANIFQKFQVYSYKKK